MKTIERRLLILIPVTMALAFIGFAMTIESARTYAHGAHEHETAAPAGTEPGGPFSLTDQDGRHVTEKDFDGKYRLVYFGFTSCPDVCPLDLKKITEALTMLDAGRRAEITPIFITVDPDRDTPKVMKDYVSLFKPSPVGLTGSKEDIKKVEDGYKVYAARAENKSGGDYTMNHSAYIYLMGPDNHFIDIFSSDDKADAIAARLKKIVPQG